MGRALLRLGGLLIVVAVIYLAAAELLGRVDNDVFRNIGAAGLVCAGLGLLLTILGRGVAGIVARSCPRCGRRVPRGRVYCDDHLQETINEYRDEQRGRGH